MIVMLDKTNDNRSFIDELKSIENNLITMDSSGSYYIITDNDYITNIVTMCGYQEVSADRAYTLFRINNKVAKFVAPYIVNHPNYYRAFTLLTTKKIRVSDFARYSYFFGDDSTLEAAVVAVLRSLNDTLMAYRIRLDALELDFDQEFLKASYAMPDYSNINADSIWVTIQDTVRKVDRKFVYNFVEELNSVLRYYEHRGYSVSKQLVV